MKTVIPELIGKWRQLHKQAFKELCSSLNVFNMTSDVARDEKTRNTPAKKQLVKTRYKWKDTGTNCKEITF